MVNDLSSDHLPLVLRFEVGEFYLEIPQAFSVNWEDLGHVLKNMGAPPTEIHCDEGVTSFIQVFGDSLQNAFQKVAKPIREWSTYSYYLSRPGI